MLWPAIRAPIRLGFRSSGSGPSIAHRNDRAANAIASPAPIRSASHDVLVVAVVLTHNRPNLLTRCVEDLLAQARVPDHILIVNNGSTTPLPDRVTARRRVRVLELAENRGPAAGYGAGACEALALGATHVWLMDDDGRPEDAGCLAALLATAAREASAITCPLVRNVQQPERLAFPIRQHGRTRFTAAALDPQPVIDGFAHLFNGALIAAETFRRIGLPDARLFMRGDEVEFLFRARRASLRVVTDTRVGFLHPACDPEVHAILGGAFYAMVPREPLKRYCQFRNRGWIFWRYGMQGWLLADHLRYACHFLIEARDPAGYLSWLRATWHGVLGRLDAPLPALRQGP